MLQFPVSVMFRLPPPFENVPVPCTSKLPARLKLFVAIDTLAPVSTLSVPICTAVLIVVPDPVITIVELPGVPNVPEIATFPEAVMVLVKVLFTVPDDVKAPHTILPPLAVWKFIVPVFTIAWAPAAICPVPPETFTVPAKLESAPSVSTCVPTASVAPD